jgi:hypothetical protein
MIINPWPEQGLMILLSYLLFLSFYMLGTQVYTQSDSEAIRKNTATSSLVPVPDGLYMLQYASPAGFGALPVDQYYTFDGVSNESTWSSSSGQLYRKILNETEISRIKSSFSQYIVGGGSLIDNTTGDRSTLSFIAAVREPEMVHVYSDVIIVGEWESHDPEEERFIENIIKFLRIFTGIAREGIEDTQRLPLQPKPT